MYSQISVTFVGKARKTPRHNGKDMLEIYKCTKGMLVWLLLSSSMLACNVACNTKRGREERR